MANFLEAVGAGLLAVLCILIMCSPIFILFFGVSQILMSDSKAEKQYLEEHPLCVVCQRQGRFTKATRVWKETNGNWQARCEKHCEVKQL